MIITGRVIDTIGEGIPGALVHDGSNGIQTANDGSFELESNAQFINAVMVGFVEQTKPSAPMMEFMLVESPNSMLNAVEIIAFRAKNNPVATVSVVLLLLLLLSQVI